MSRVWLLNLDAEIEVEARAPYPGPFAALAKRPELAAKLTALIPTGDEVLRAAPASGSLRGRRAMMWSPTPRAVAVLVAGGAEVAAVPPATLRAVMSRAFSASLGLGIAGSAWFDEPAPALAAVRAPSPSGRWLVRRAYGFAGKARRAFSEPEAADERFVETAAREGGVLIEPFVTVTADFGLHGFVDDDQLVLGEPVRNEVGPGGVFRQSQRASADDLAPAERQALDREGERAGEALRAAGYRGPYGVDAFRYSVEAREGFQPRCEINPRYSMAWAVGMGDRRPDLEL